MNNAFLLDWEIVGSPFSTFDASNLVFFEEHFASVGFYEKGLCCLVETRNWLFLLLFFSSIEKGAGFVECPFSFKSGSIF